MFSGMNYVYEVYKMRSFSKAAQKLFIAQPALSAAIKKTETKVGMPIFDRSTSPIRLTECGEEYIKAVEQIMEIEQNFSGYLNQLNSLSTGHISIGSSSFFASFVLPPMIAGFQARFPHIDISLLEGNTPFLEDQLLSGNLDLAIDNNIFNYMLYEHKVLKEEQLLLAVPYKFESNQQAAAYALTQEDILNDVHTKDTGKLVSLDVFQNDNFVLLKHGNESRSRADRILRRAGITPNIVLSLDQQLTAYNLTCSGMGATFVTDTLVKYVPSHGRVVFYRLPSSEAWLNLYFYYKKNNYITRAMQEFLNNFESFQANMNGADLL